MTAVKSDTRKYITSRETLVQKMSSRGDVTYWTVGSPSSGRATLLLRESAYQPIKSMLSAPMRRTE
jgi:hypothetical protein